MTMTELNARYRKEMCGQIASICKKQLGELPKSADEEKNGLFGRKRREQERAKLCSILRACFEVSLAGGEQMGYDALCDAVWNELKVRVPYWRAIIRLCNESGSLDVDEEQTVPWESFMDELDLLDFAMYLEDTYGVELRDEIAHEVCVREPSAKDLLDILRPVIDEQGLLDG